MDSAAFGNKFYEGFFKDKHNVKSQGQLLVFI